MCHLLKLKLKLNLVELVILSDAFVLRLFHEFFEIYLGRQQAIHIEFSVLDHINILLILELSTFFQLWT